MRGFWDCKTYLEAPFCSLAVRRFRWAAAMVTALYFTRLATEVPLLSSASGLLDHQALPWLAWQPILSLHSPEPVIRGLLLLGAVLCLAAARFRFAALGAYVLAVCFYRWNLAILSVDDGMAHLLLFWMVLLPDGRADRVTVRGVVPRLILTNLSLIYLVAGITKWTSPMWREGSALYAVLMLPGSRAPEAVLNSCLPLLCLLTWIALMLEPALSAVPWAKPATRRWLVVLGLLFHLGIALAFDVPVANLACLTIYILALAPDPEPDPEPVACRPPWSGTERFGLVVLVLLTSAMLGSAWQPSWRAPGQTAQEMMDEAGGPLQKALYSSLWALGLAQQYRLLDWIDERNFSVTCQILDAEGAWSKPEPLPANLRLGLAMTYLTPVCWQPLPAEQIRQWRQRCSPRWARFLGQESRVRVNIHRVHPDTAGRHPLVQTIDLPEGGP